MDQTFLFEKLSSCLQLFKRKLTVLGKLNDQSGLEEQLILTQLLEINNQSVTEVEKLMGFDEKIYNTSFIRYFSRLHEVVRVWMSKMQQQPTDMQNFLKKMDCLLLKGMKTDQPWVIMSKIAQALPETSRQKILKTFGITLLQLPTPKQALPIEKALSMATMPMQNPKQQEKKENRPLDCFLRNSQVYSCIDFDKGEFRGMYFNIKQPNLKIDLQRDMKYRNRSIQYTINSYSEEYTHFINRPQKRRIVKSSNSVKPRVKSSRSALEKSATQPSMGEAKVAHTNLSSARETVKPPITTISYYALNSGNKKEPFKRRQYESYKKDAKTTVHQEFQMSKIVISGKVEMMPRNEMSRLRRKQFSKMTYENVRKRTGYIYSLYKKNQIKDTYDMHKLGAQWGIQGSKAF